VEEIRSRIFPVLKRATMSIRKGRRSTSSRRMAVRRADLLCDQAQEHVPLRHRLGRESLGLTGELLHAEAIANLVAAKWPKQLLGMGAKGEGRLIIVDTDDNLASSGCCTGLAQDVHWPARLNFWAGIPCRDRLVLYSDRREMKQRIARRIKKDHAASAYRSRRSRSW